MLYYADEESIRAWKAHPEHLEAQRRWRTALDGLPVLWVGVRCEAAVAAAREAGRPDRLPGMALAQAEGVHQGVVYDLEVDTSRVGAVDRASAIASRL